MQKNIDYMIILLVAVQIGNILRKIQFDKPCKRGYVTGRSYPVHKLQKHYTLMGGLHSAEKRKDLFENVRNLSLPNNIHVRKPDYDIVTV